MAYNEELAQRIRERLENVENVEEKKMMGGLAFMVNDKMCVGVIKDEMMCRIDPVDIPNALERPGSRPMDFTGRPMKSFIQVDEIGLQKNADFDFWINLCLDFNPRAKASKKKK
ncbi:TfoX/Sxy family protein [Jiulongibacter sediminis]|jgi:TfoX/Sxy family transcriptional regulator of competence genes|uniref:RNA methyltransferase n=1 Tax=Jiulongibacter sediminis TaxID=1605367 RepID=A0A0P7BX03_9BACT|nr:TfoX/Sxy family protein [Jiulongibacter sediminis]KPM49139.1 RNA methyltransferase [Jiulongibacter sediminis]TBX26195.1 RNA methyltransferase [Jiulongibacter sediminis]